MVPQTKGSIELYQTEIARRTARRTAGASRIRPLRVSWRPSLAAVVIVCAIVALTVVAPAASAARQDTENSLKLTIGVDATFETPTLSISVQVSGQVAAFGIPWDIAGLTIPISYIVRAVATLSGQSDTCSVQTTGVVTADASVEMAPEADLVGWQVAIHAVGDRARCQALGQDMITDWEFLVEHASKTEPSTGEVIVESRSSSRVSLQVVDTRTGTPIAGRVSESTLRSRTVVEPSEPDKTGRVKVQFHWDKAESSTWIRVAEPHTMGSMILPRLKWEVAVGGAILEGSSERREELRLEFPESRVDPPSIVFRSRSGHRLMFDDADLARQESLVTGAGSWVGEVPEDEGQVSGVVEFGAALRLDDRRQPDEPVRGGGDSPRAPVVDQQHHEVRDLADVNGQDLLGTAPSVRFGTSVEAPAPSPVGLEVRQAVRVDTGDVRWPRFQFTLPAYELDIRITIPGARTDEVRLQASAETTVRGDAESGDAEVEVRHRLFAIIDRTSLPLIRVETTSVEFMSISLSPPEQDAPVVHGKFNNLKQISLGITERSNVFAVWTTTGFFRVTEDGFDLRGEGRIEVEGNVDPPEVQEPLSLDLDFGYSIDGRKFKPLFAFHIAELDNRINLMVGGTLLRAQGGTRSPALFGPGGLMEPSSFFGVIVTTPTEQFAAQTDTDAVASVEGDAFLVDFAGMTVG